MIGPLTLSGMLASTRSMLLARRGSQRLVALLLLLVLRVGTVVSLGSTHKWDGEMMRDRRERGRRV
jgi:hypothetical protein